MLSFLHNILLHILGPAPGINSVRDRGIVERIARNAHEWPKYRMQGCDLIQSVELQVPSMELKGAFAMLLRDSWQEYVHESLSMCTIVRV